MVFGQDKLWQGFVIRWIEKGFNYARIPFPAEIIPDVLAVLKLRDLVPIKFRRAMRTVEPNIQ
jgi:hypothetical protein